MYHHRHLFLRLIALVDANPAAPLRCLAATLHVHPHTLGAIVRVHAGERWAGWIAARRLAIACNLLANRPDLAVKEIAVRAGFGSSSAFDRFLRRQTGLTPTAWRRRMPAPNDDSAAVNELVRRSTNRRRCTGATGGTLDPSGPAS